MQKCAHYCSFYHCIIITDPLLTGTSKLLKNKNDSNHFIFHEFISFAWNLISKTYEYLAVRYNVFVFTVCIQLSSYRLRCHVCYFLIELTRAALTLSALVFKAEPLSSNKLVSPHACCSFTQFCHLRKFSVEIVWSWMKAGGLCERHKNVCRSASLMAACKNPPAL